MTQETISKIFMTISEYTDSFRYQAVRTQASSQPPYAVTFMITRRLDLTTLTSLKYRFEKDSLRISVSPREGGYLEIRFDEIN